jgi:hypothetical protein
MWIKNRLIIAEQQHQIPTNTNYWFGFLHADAGILHN